MAALAQNDVRAPIVKHTSDRVSVLSKSKISSMFYGLYDNVIGDNDDAMDEDTFRHKLDELIDCGYIDTSTLDDTQIYTATAGLSWDAFVHIADPVKKSILLLLVDNPTTFFVLQNTQKGKMRIASLEIKQWGQDASKKVVAFIIVDNDKTLADQSVDGIEKTFEGQPVKIYRLSSTSKTTYDDIKTYIAAYEHDMDGEFAMPVIALLANPKQNEKMVKLLHYIDKKVTVHRSLLRYGIIWDEADKTYPMLRMKQVGIEGTVVSCHTFIVRQNTGLYRLGFVSATDGDLLENEEYPECANAYLYPDVISEEDKEYYRALHHSDSIVHRVPFTSKHTNNSYAMQCIEEHKEHFTTPIELPSGEMYYRKIIVNSNARTADMRSFARWCTANGFYALVFNGFGGASVTIYRDGVLVGKCKTNNKRLNELVFYIYKMYDLHDKPMVIIGKRKVDRGLGFHYCPRTDAMYSIDGPLGILHTGNKDSLVWSDVILGKIEDKNTAVQKAGRGAGIIAHSPQYSGTIHYWTDEHTEMLIRRHNTIVDAANAISGYSALQAVEYAKNTTPEIKVNHRVTLDTFLVYTNESTVRTVCAFLEYAYKAVAPSTDGPNHGFIETSLNARKDKVSLLDAIKKVPTAYGTNHGVITWRTYYPCYKDINDSTTLHYVIIIRPGTDIEKLDYIRETYESITIPQEGDY